MGRLERKRYSDNGKVADLLQESRNRPLTDEEIAEIKASYTGHGGLTKYTNGQFFTPGVVSDFIIDLLDIPRGPNIISVLEPTCGAGAFFNAIPETCSITGVEMMYEASQVARLCYPHVNVITGNTLEMVEDLREKYHYVVGNPPFMKLKYTPQFAGIEQTQKSSKAEWFFVELAYHALKPGGICAYIVPDGILSNHGDLPYRKWLLENTWVRAVISLPAETFRFVGTTVKTSVLVFQKKFNNLDIPDENYQVIMSVVENIGWDSRGRLTNKCDLPDVLRYVKEGPVSLHIIPPENPTEILSETSVAPIEDPPSKVSIVKQVQLSLF